MDLQSIPKITLTKSIYLTTNNRTTMGEIITTAACCFAITLFGLGLGFVFLQVQANT